MDWSCHDLAWLFVVFTCNSFHAQSGIPPSHLRIPLIVTCTINYFILIPKNEQRVGFMVIEKPNYVTSVTNGKFTTANPIPRQILQKQMFCVDNSTSTEYFHIMPVNRAINTFLGPGHVMTLSSYHLASQGLSNVIFTNVSSPHLVVFI